MQQYVVSVAATTSTNWGDASNPLTPTSTISNSESAIPSTAAATVIACIIVMILGVTVTVCSYSTFNVSFVM